MCYNDEMNTNQLGKSSRLRSFLKHEVVSYLFFGVLTTFVYYVFMAGSLIMMDNSVPDQSAISEIIGQIAAILFAFLTNKYFVFKHKSEHVFLDFINFVGGRLIFTVLSVLVKWWLGDVQPQILMKAFHADRTAMILILSVILQALNIILNYFYSKFLVFRKKRNTAT